MNDVETANLVLNVIILFLFVIVIIIAMRWNSRVQFIYKKILLALQL